MMQITTRFFGALECPEEAIIRFPSGIPPFSDQQAFVVVSDENSPLVFLQSVAAPELCFITVPLQTIDPAYQLQVEPFDLQALALEAPPCGMDGLTCLTILTIPEQGPTTANLAAPIVINPVTKVGVQAVRSDRTYSHAYPLEPVST
ncbi:MAG TPA: flagellar assembly protein FliW [Phycisphaerae bacterium]|jgi:flagellar assembly factor FliW|nr:flagellar assembly protein FliW [Phycisphaerae bacterium]HWB96806.1 flagellar assembly protein FliW [Bryobacteraceae bacterium]